MINDDLKKAAKALGRAKKADVFAFNAAVESNPVDQIISAVRKLKTRQKNAVLLLTTTGGSPDDGYRLSRHLQANYAKFTTVVLGQCKSAGTLIALGAAEIAMGDFGELGPLDVQVGKEDELTLTSGLVYTHALFNLRDQAFAAWENHFLEIKRKSYGNISTKTAAEIACNLTNGMFAQIAGQIDPHRLGEFARACKIALEYGMRLHGTEAVELRAVYALVANYPSHSFAIDRFEAAKFIRTARCLDKTEKAFEDIALDYFRYEIEDENDQLSDAIYSLEYAKKPGPKTAGKKPVSIPVATEQAPHSETQSGNGNSTDSATKLEIGRHHVS